MNSMQMGFTCCCILKFQGIFIRKFVLGIIHIIAESGSYLLVKYSFLPRYICSSVSCEVIGESAGNGPAHVTDYNTPPCFEKD